MIEFFKQKSDNLINLLNKVGIFLFEIKNNLNDSSALEVEKIIKEISKMNQF